MTTCSLNSKGSRWLKGGHGYARYVAKRFLVDIPSVHEKKVATDCVLVFSLGIFVRSNVPSR